MCSQLKNLYICTYVQENVSLCTYKVQIKKKSLVTDFFNWLNEEEKKKKNIKQLTATKIHLIKRWRIQLTEFPAENKDLWLGHNSC